MNEFSNKLERQIMDNFRETIIHKPYPKILGVWEIREILPKTYDSDFNKIDKPLLIPLRGEGCINIGRTNSSPMEIGLDVEFPTARGDEQMFKYSTIITNHFEEDEPYPFWIFFDDYNDPNQRELIKFLSKFEPDKDIDWDKIKQNTKEMTVALSLCKYADFEGQPYEKPTP